ncbi:MAG: hypothetical protein AAF587_28240 [Bacteroidota bacterium]
MKLPVQTPEIFHRLSRGLFISSNTTDREQEQLYQIIETHFEELERYFRIIQFRLNKGDEYYYFSRELNRSSLEDKLERAYRYIDVLDFFKTFDPAFGSGFRFSPDQIAQKCKVDTELRTKLDSLKTKGQSENRLDKVRTLVKSLEKESFVELIDKLQETYLVLASFSYLELLIDRIQIEDES